MNYLAMDLKQLEQHEAELAKEYDELKNKNLKIDMTRGKPCSEQLDISEGMLNSISCIAECLTEY